MKKLLYTFLLTILFLTACYKEEEIIPQRFASFFPYEETWEERKFQTPHGVETLNLGVSFEKEDSDPHGIVERIVNFVLVGNFRYNNDTLLPIKSCIMFFCHGEGNSFSSQLYTDGYTYSPRSVNDIIREDTLYLGTWMTFIRDKGLTMIKWPKKESVSKSEIESYPNTPWGETWTLIE
ncbi:MAG: hypothetical protein MJ069_10535 [Salinivirgaceae bacterium]|nr:hypothetical protein [Salinivirgaceae bacterium]